MAEFIPEEVGYLLYTLLFITALTTALISTRGPAYFLILIVTATHVITNLQQHIPAYNWITYTGLTIVAVMAGENIQQLKSLGRRQINSPQNINELSKQ